MTPLLLQALVQIPQGNPVSAIVGVAVVVAGIVALFMIFGGRGARPGAGRRRFSPSRFRRAARGLGLDKTQVKTLENLCVKYPSANPHALLTSPTSLDAFLKRAINEIDQQSQSSAVKEAHKATLFRIKQLIEQNSQKRAMSGSSQLAIGQKVSVIGPDGVRHPTTVTGNLRDYVTMDIPTDNAGDQVRWKKWTPVKVFSTRPNGQAYSFQSKVGGYNEVRGVESLLINQTTQVQQAVQRKLRRKPLEKPAYFYAVQIMTIAEGREQRKRAVAQTKGALGTVLEVSAGGCSVRTSLPLAKGSLIKIEFEIAKTRPVVVFGKVRDVRRSPPAGGIMHVMFTQVSRQNLNKINQFVYEIG